MTRLYGRVRIRSFIVIMSILVVIFVTTIVGVLWLGKSIEYKRHLNDELNEAIYLRDAAKVDELLKRGADPSNLQDGAEITPLMEAIDNSDIATVKVMLQRGADPNAEGAYGGTPLQVAVSRGNTDIFHLLLSHGAKLGDLNVWLRTAAFYGHESMVKDMITMGADPSVDLGESGTVLHGIKLTKMAKILVDAGCPVDRKDGEGRTPLHLAASDGNMEMTKFLLSLGADVHVKDNSGSTPIALAQRNGHDSVVQLLVGK